MVLVQSYPVHQESENGRLADRHLQESHQLDQKVQKSNSQERGNIKPRDFPAGGERRNGEDYPTEWSSLEIYPHPADSDSADVEENINTELEDRQVGNPPGNNGFSDENKLLTEQAERNLLPDHQVSEKADKGSSGSKHIESIDESFSDNVKDLDKGKVDHSPFLELSNSIGSGKSGARPADDLSLENLPTPSQLTATEDFQMVPPVQNLMIRTMNVIEESAESDSKKYEQPARRKDGGESHGLRSTKDPEGINSESNENLKWFEKRKILGAANGATDHSGGQVKVPGSKMAAVMEKKFSESSDDIENPIEVAEEEKGNNNIADVMRKPENESQTYSRVDFGEVSRTEEEENSTKREEMQAVRSNLEDEVFLLPAGHGLVLKMKLRHSQKPLLSFYSHD